jgi:hypothetical protein
VANVTYKHLEGKTLVGPLSLWQWAQLFAGIVAGVVFGLYLSPLPATATVFVSCLLPGLPLAAGYGAMGLEFSLWQMARAALRYWRKPRHHLPGPGHSATGYLVQPEPDPLAPIARHRPSTAEVSPVHNVEELWDA